MFKFLDNLNQQWAVNCYQSGNQPKRELSPALKAEKERLEREQKERQQKGQN